MAKYLDMDGLRYVNAKLNTKFDTKVDKINGKGLSTNDFTTEEKTKLAGLENYTLPTASTDLGGVKTTSTVSNTEGLTAAPIINGVVYYKDTDTTYINATSTADGLLSKEDKAVIDGLETTYAKKSDITNMYKYKGSVANYDALPSTDLTAGDVYDVQTNGMNYAWNGSAWDALGEIFSIESITNTEIDSIFTGE